MGKPIILIIGKKGRGFLQDEESISTIKQAEARGMKYRIEFAEKNTFKKYAEKYDLL